MPLKNLSSTTEYRIILIIRYYSLYDERQLLEFTINENFKTKEGPARSEELKFFFIILVLIIILIILFCCVCASCAFIGSAFKKNLNKTIFFHNSSFLLRSLHEMQKK